MAGLSAVGGLLGVGGVLLAAVAVFLQGPRLLVQAARSLAVGGLIVGLVGLLQELAANGFQLDMSRGGSGRGSLFAAAGTLLLTFGAARVAERRRARIDRERWMAEQRAARR